MSRRQAAADYCLSQSSAQYALSLEPSSEPPSSGAGLSRPYAAYQLPVGYGAPLRWV